MSDVQGIPTGDVWQPISSAPRDGSHILGCISGSHMEYRDGVRVPLQTVVHWWANPGEEGFYTSVNERAPEKPFAATHWRPLGIEVPKDVTARSPNQEPPK